MPKVTHVKAAQKDVPNSDIKKGEPYYWWKFRFGGKRVSRTAPKPSQLTQSSFWGPVLALREQNEHAPSTIADLESGIESIKDELENIKSETEDKLSNMPDSLQQGPTGEQLQNRIDSLDSAISDLDSVDTSYDEPEDEEEQDSLEADRCAEIWDEVLGIIDNISE